MTLKDLLEELQREYLASMPDKIVRVQQLWDEGEYTDLETEYHKMKGTGRTYGLGEVTQVGEALERLCEIRSMNQNPSQFSDPLVTAVPLSLKVLEKIRVSRLAGNPFLVEDDPDFKAIIQLVVSSS